MGQKNSAGNRHHYVTDNIKSFEVKKETTLLPFLLETLATLTRTEVKTLLKFKHVAVKGEAVTQFNIPLMPGDVVDVNFGRSFYKFDNPQVKILYEDEWMVVIEKASGLLSVANENEKYHTAFNIVRDYVRRNEPNADVFVCHRLDQYTSGILIFSKNEAMMLEMRTNWNFYVKERKYVCVTECVPLKTEDDIETLLSENDKMQVHSTDNEQDGRLAMTHYRVIQSRGRYALVDVEIFTGKKNQIRVHMSEMGCPIAGDLKYGAETNPARRLMLHNYRLTFIHPVTGELMRFSLPTPQVFTKLTKPDNR